jgi:hypothetical protein
LLQLGQVASHQYLFSEDKQRQDRLQEHSKVVLPQSQTSYGFLCLNSDWVLSTYLPRFFQYMRCAGRESLLQKIRNNQDHFLARQNREECFQSCVSFIHR